MLGGPLKIAFRPQLGYVDYTDFGAMLHLCCLPLGNHRKVYFAEAYTTRLITALRQI